MLAMQGLIQNRTTFTGPSLLFCRHPHHQGMIRYILGDYSPTADECPSTDGYPTDDGCIGPDGSSLLYESFQIACLPLRVFCPRGKIVCENTGRPAEHMVLEGHHLVDRDVVLDLHLVAELDAPGHEHVLAEGAAAPEAGPGHDVAEVPHLGP